MLEILDKNIIKMKIIILPLLKIIGQVLVFKIKILLFLY